MVEVAAAVLRSVWWLLLLAGVLLGGAGLLASAGDPSWLSLAVDVTGFLVLGVVGSFLVHELAHVAALRLAGVRHVEVEQVRWRISVLPVGALPSRGADALVALAGPGTAAAVGASTWVWSPELAACYLVHLLFLLPVFGDGRRVLRYLLGEGKPAREVGHNVTHARAATFATMPVDRPGPPFAPKD